jgi:hypothetical protein
MKMSEVYSGIVLLDISYLDPQVPPRPGIFLIFVRKKNQPIVCGQLLGSVVSKRVCKEDDAKTF